MAVQDCSRRKVSTHMGNPRWRTLFMGLLVAVLALLPGLAAAQNAQLSGVVRDSEGGPIENAEVRLVDEATRIVTASRSNGRGIYVFPSVRPSSYRLEVSADAFAPLAQEGVVLTVDQRSVLDLTLGLRGRTESVTVSAPRVPLRAADGAVTTLIDRQFAENLPVRGRSFSALVALSPGTVTMPVSSGSGSEFSVNGQRTTANSLTVDGVSGLAEMDSGGGANVAGQRLTSTVTGTVNGLVSMDALQEVRVQTSSFAPEFGRTPGAQISLVTRSGTNRLRGGLFEQFRNDKMMGNDWFLNSRGAAKPPMEEHQFGASLGGPVIRNRTFFFGTYEGLRLLRPNVQFISVPSLEAREREGPAKAPLNAYPLPTGPSRSDFTAEYVANHPVHQSFDTLGVRLDHLVSPGVQVFARYSRTPSDTEDEYPLAFVATVDKAAQIATGGLTATLGQRTLLEIRGSYGTSDFAHSALPKPAVRSFFNLDQSPSAYAQMSVSGITTLATGTPAANIQRQGNLVFSISRVATSHHFKAGGDYRRLDPTIFPLHIVQAQFTGVTQLTTTATVPQLTVQRLFPLDATFENFSMYAQDTWKALDRLSLTYGVRWDINPSPSFAAGQGPLAALDVDPISHLKLSPSQNAPLWKTQYSNIYPRFGLSYALDGNARTVLAGGGGIFGDLDGQAVSPNVLTSLTRTNVPLPLTPADVVGIDSPQLNPPYRSTLTVVDPNLEGPRIIQWNIALDRAIGRDQSVSLTYVGAHGDRMLQSRLYSPGFSPGFLANVTLRSGFGKSSYKSMQVQYRRRASAGLNVLASYSLGESKDTTSTNIVTDRSLEGELTPADNDVRHVFTFGSSWMLPNVQAGPMTWLLKDWGLHSFGLARSGLPFTVTSSNLTPPGEERFTRRGSLVPGVPFIVDDPTAPGGQRFNRAAFIDPPAGQQGDTGRNEFRGFAAYQLDLGLRRSFPVATEAKVLFRVDVFNVFNIPIFGAPSGSLASTQFGIPIASAAQGSDAYYRAGGPRSAAVTVRLEF